MQDLQCHSDAREPAPPGRGMSESTPEEMDARLKRIEALLRDGWRERTGGASRWGRWLPADVHPREALDRIRVILEGGDPDEDVMLWDVDLPSVVSNTLRREGFLTLRSALSMDRDSVRGIPGFGAKRRGVILDRGAMYGLPTPEWE